MKENITYYSSGMVYGKLWGGGEGAYPAEKNQDATLEDLLATNKKMIENGSLDSGMGYESLLGALLDIKKVTEISIGDKLFTNVEYLDHEMIGDLTEEQQDFLLDNKYNS